MWNELKTSGDISKYEKLAAKDRKRYEKEKGVAPTKTKKTRTKKTEHVQNDTGRKKTGYQIFCAQKRPELKQENPKFDAKDITKELSRLWRSLSDEEKESIKV